MTDGIFRIKKRVVRWCGIFCGWFYRWNHRGIQNGNSVRWRDRFTVRIADKLTKGFKPESPCNDVTYLPSEWPTEYIRRWVHRQKLIYDHPADPLLPYFSFFFPIQLSHTANNQPPQKKSPSSQHNKSYFLKFCGHNIHVLIYRWILSVFESNSIFLNFNI